MRDVVRLVLSLYEGRKFNDLYLDDKGRIMELTEATNSQASPHHR